MKSFIGDLYSVLAKCHSSIKRGRVWCRKCGETKKVNPEYCFQYGWPKCCNVTMTIDKPKEKK